MGYYVYKYVKNNRVEYIGKTTDLDRRIQQHTKDKLANFEGKIYYFQCPNKTAMDSWEYSLINKHHPIYNVALKDKNISINIDEPEWIEYGGITTANANLDNVLYFPIKKRLNNSEIFTEPELEVFVKPNRKFRCYKCRLSFVSNEWYPTKKGFSATCPSCLCAAWIPKSAV